jgi:serine/threonine protein kinase/tetratricopeptide (TPR) repeat protein
MLGTLLNQYRIEDKLGEGGMGTVYRARDIRLDRDVALKVLALDRSADPRRKARFAREAKAASALNHPNIITIYEINSCDGIDWIAMELVRGSTLRELLESGAQPMDKVLRWASQIASGLATAHEAKLVHRDLKPANIMIRDDGLVKILDFGLVKLNALEPVEPSETAETEATLTALTQAGRIVGTVAYMSPEQAQGLMVDHRADIFSFGVILYEMTTGRRPFHGATPIAVFHEVLYNKPQPMCKLRPEAPLELEILAEWTMAKKPEERPDTLAEVSQALTEIAAQRGLSTGPLSQSGMRSDVNLRRLPPATATRPRPRSRWLLIAAAAALLLGSGLYWMWPGIRSSSGVGLIRSGASAYELCREGQSLLVRGDKEGHIDRAIALFHLAIRQEPRHALAYAGLAEGYIQKYIEAPDPAWLNLAGDNARRAVELNSQMAAAQSALGRYLHLEKRYSEAAQALDKAVAMDPLSGEAQSRLALVLGAQNMMEAAERMHRRATETSPREWIVWSSYATFLHGQGRYQEATAMFEKAAQAAPDNYIVYRNLAGAYYSQGRYDESASALQRSLEMRPTGGVYSNLGTLHFFNGRYREAAAMFEKATQMDPAKYLYWGNLGDACRWVAGMTGKSAEAYRKAIQGAGEELQKSPQDFAVRSRMATYLAKNGQIKEALEQIRIAGNAAGNNPAFLYRLAVVRELAGDRTGSIMALEEALKGGYSLEEVKRDPELVNLRRDARFFRLASK